MTNLKPKKQIIKISLIILTLVVLGIALIPLLYRQYCSAPQYDSRSKSIILKSSQEQKNTLNSFQQRQFIKIGKNVVESKRGPMNWNQYKVELSQLNKRPELHEYSMVLHINPKSVPGSKKSIVINIEFQLMHENLLQYNDVHIISYSSMN